MCKRRRAGTGSGPLRGLCCWLIPWSREPGIFPPPPVLCLLTLFSQRIFTKKLFFQVVLKYTLYCKTGLIISLLFFNIWKRGQLWTAHASNQDSGCHFHLICKENVGFLESLSANSSVRSLAMVDEMAWPLVCCHVQLKQCVGSFLGCTWSNEEDGERGSTNIFSFSIWWELDVLSVPNLHTFWTWIFPDAVLSLFRSYSGFQKLSTTRSWPAVLKACRSGEKSPLQLHWAIGGPTAIACFTLFPRIWCTACRFCSRAVVEVSKQQELPEGRTLENQITEQKVCPALALSSVGFLLCICQVESAGPYFVRTKSQCVVSSSDELPIAF